jgi:pantoate--beta-alanine ligase
VVVSLFVNPTQFGPNEDFDRYPRDPAGDERAAREEGVDVLFTPSVAEMYPGYPELTTVHVASISDGLCGAGRPGHFDGVATVVAKLFAQVGPCTAYFGRKDAQQLAVVRRLAADLCLPVEVVGCSLVREPDGLALSSRNRKLEPEQRRAASVLYRALRAGADLVESGERDASRLRRVVANTVTNEELVRLEYAEVVGADDLTPVQALSGDVLVAVAARVGDVRLIDNMTVTVGSGAAAADLGVFTRGEVTCAAR